MMNTSLRCKDVPLLVFGAGFPSFGLWWVWSLREYFPHQLWSALNDPFLMVLCVASVVAAGWLLRRHRGRGYRTPTTGNGLNQPIESVFADRSALGRERDPKSADDYETLRWLVRLGCVASAVLLAGLVIGNLPAVIITVALAQVVIAFVLIVVLLPRGL